MQYRWLGVCALVATVLSGGCSAARVDERVAEGTTLHDNKQAVALFLITKTDPACLTMGAQLGVRQGEFFRPVQTLKLQQPQVTLVAEALLPAGEYHIVSLTCFRARTTLVMSEPQGNGLMRRSYAGFTLAAGEVVNLGQVQAVAISRSPGLHTPFVNVAVQITDWPLAEVERFKSQRPKLYAEMRARLMTANTPPSSPEAAEQKCAELKRLQADGKVQNLPAACLPQPAAAGKNGQRT